MAKKNKIGLVDFAFVLDYNVNAVSASVSVTSETTGYIETTTTSKKWAFDFTDALFVSTSGATFVNPEFKTAFWISGPQYKMTFPAYLDNSYITAIDENDDRWDKSINTVNFDVSVDQEKYKEIYLKTLKSYIDVYVGRMAALDPK